MEMMKTTKFAKSIAMKAAMLAMLVTVAAVQSRAAVEWIDMTDEYLTNPRFDGIGGWSWYAFGSFNMQDGCIEFRNGNFDMFQYISIPKGHYRLSVQGFYRSGGAENSYKNYRSGKESLDAMLYVWSGQDNYPMVELPSVFSESLDYNAAENCWSSDQKTFFPNGLKAANECFAKGMYLCQLEFDTDSEDYICIGVERHADSRNGWCAFDNFKLEYQGEMVLATGIELKMNTTELIVGEKVVGQVTLTPDNVLKRRLNWTSDNPSVVTVNEGGLMTAVGEGQATITVTTTDGTDLSDKVTVSVSHNPAGPGKLVVNEIMASNVDQYISPATNFDGWVELYNPTDRGVELTGIWLSDDKTNLRKWKLPWVGQVLSAKESRLVWFGSNEVEGTNAPFKLDVDGGTVCLSTDEGELLASEDYPAGMERVSYARTTDAGNTWGLTSTPTPGYSNNEATFASQQLQAPVVDQPSQLFTGTLAVKVDIPAGCTLRYTTDGTLPTAGNGKSSTTGRFSVKATTCYRFRLFADDKLASTVTSRSYILRDKNYTLPVVSVVTDPDFLYDDEIGVYVQGYNGRPGNGQRYPCNWNMEWERPVNFSYLDAEGKMVFNQDVNLEICGGWSRAWYPRSFKLKGNKELGGSKNLAYPFFTQKPYIRNRTLQIRNGGNDTQCRFKDPALQYMVQTSGIDVDCQSYQPIHEFINGEYVGVLNMREPNNKHYVYANYGWDDDEIDQFEMSPDSGYVQKCGTPEAFDELVDVLSPDAANSQTYDEICRMLDIDEYINYMATVLYLGSTDWPQNNVKGFRHRDGGRFRFVLFDVDHAFNTNDPFNTMMQKEHYTFDPLYPESLGRISANIKMVTLFKNLLKNADFRRQFIDTYCLMGGSVFQANRAREIVDELSARVTPAMTLEGGSVNPTAPDVKQKLNSRLSSAITALRNYSAFNLKSTNAQTVTLESDTEGTQLFINGLRVPTGRFVGRLFPPVVFKAVAPAGYVFQGWQTGSGSTAKIIATEDTLAMPTGAVSLTAVCRPMTDEERADQGVTPVRINEVSASNDVYVNSYGKKNDWVELCNTTDEEVDVEGMFMTDDLEKPEKYMITKGSTAAVTTIPARGKLIIWCDKLETNDSELHASFKVSGDGGCVALMAADHSWTDKLYYDEHDGNSTVGRFPDGGTSVYLMNVPTIGQPNMLSSYVTPVTQPGNGDTGLRDIVAAAGFRVSYGSGMLVVKGSEDSTALVEVYTPDGKLAVASTASLRGGVAHVSVAWLPAGCYIARVTNGQGSVVSCKFLK